MSTRKRRAGDKLVLGDYITVHVPGVNVNPKGVGAPHNMLVKHEDLFERIRKELGELNSAGYRAAA